MSEENNIPVDNSPVESTTDNSLLGSEPVTEPTSAESAPVEPTVADNSFIDSLPDEYKGFAEKKGFKDAASALKSLQNLESKLGKRMEDLTAEEIQAIDKKFGAPESAEDYGLELSDSFKEDPILKDIANDFHAVGLPKNKAEALMAKVQEKMDAYEKDLETEIQIKEQDKVESIKKEFGSAFDKRLELANSALRKFGGEEAIKAIADAGLANDPAVFRMLSEVGKLISEDVPAGGKEVKEFGTTPDEAKNMIAELRADSAFNERARDVRHPGHAEAVAKLERLYRLASGKR